MNPLAKSVLFVLSLFLSLPGALPAQDGVRAKVMRSASSIEVLVKALDDRDRVLARRVARTLAEDSERSLEALRRVLNRRHWLDRDVALPLLRGSGRPGVKELLFSLDNTPFDRARLSVLGLLGKDAAWTLPILERLRVEAKPAVKTYLDKVFRTLGKVAGEDAGPAPSDAALVVVKWRLQRHVSSSSGKPQLRDVRLALGSGIESMQATALSVVYRLGGDASDLGGELYELASSTRDIAGTALRALISVGQRSRAELVKLVPALAVARIAGGRRERVRLAILEKGLGRRRYLPIGVVLQGLRDPSPGFRQFALQLGMQAMPKPEQARILAPLLDDPSKAVFDAAMNMLHRLGPDAAPALPVLRRLIKAGQTPRLHNVDHLLVRIGTPAMDLIEQRLADELVDGRAANVLPHMPVLSSLHLAGRAARPLFDAVLRAAASEKPYVAGWALHALGKMEFTPEDPRFAKVRAAFLARIEELRRGPGNPLANWMMMGLKAMGENASFAVPAVMKFVPGAGWFRGRYTDVDELDLLMKMGAPATDLVARCLRIVERSDANGRHARGRILPVIHKLGKLGLVLLPYLDKLVDKNEEDWVFSAWGLLGPHCDATNVHRIVKQVLKRVPRRSSLRTRGGFVVASFGASGIEALLEELDTNEWAGRVVLRMVAAHHPKLVWKHRDKLGKHMREVLEGFAVTVEPAPWMLEALRPFAKSGNKLQAVAFRALAKLGKVAVPFLQERLEAEPRSVWAVLGVAHSIGAGASVFVPAQLRAYRETKNETRKKWLLQTLPRFGPPGVVALEMLGERKEIVGPILIQALSQSDPATRQAAARALIAVRFESDRALAVMGSMLRSEEQRVRRWGVVAFLNLVPRVAKSRQHVHELEHLLSAGQPELRRKVARMMGGLSKWGDDVLVLLVECLLDPNAQVRRETLLALGRWGGDAKAAVPAIRACREDPDPTVREAATTLLQQFK